MKLHGLKTYIVGIATLMYALGGWVSGLVSPEVAIASGLTALTLMGLMHETPTPEKQ